ncbi:MAG TPA: DUF2332 domain-containing protein [Ktedonobacteraceae bacterium]|jgi:hypothetical protein
MIYDPRGWLQYVPQKLGRISPLYAHLYEGMMHDPEMRAFLGMINPEQPLPLLFFTVVNFLLLANPQHEFARFYPLLEQPPRPAAKAYPAFRAFCLEQRELLSGLLPGAQLQTNEVTRCANLLPAFEIVSRRGGRRPMVLIEIGCSAGLNLLWDSYHYDYGRHSVGNPDSPVRIRCLVHGTHNPPLPKMLPPVAHCTGIDFVPPSIHLESDVRWLQACIWPEEVARYQLLETAITLARTLPVPVLTGNAINLLPDLLERASNEQTICLWHSYALAQGPAEIPDLLESLLCEASRRHKIFRISLEAYPHQGEWPRLELYTYQGGKQRSLEWLANCEFHGQRMEWLARRV